MKHTIQNIIAESVSVKQKLMADEAAMSQIEQVANKMIESYRAGGKTLFAGNGGSAADAQHLAAELVNRFTFDHDGIPALALTTDSSVVTSISNAGDVFIGISTSGNSTNILQAFDVCREKKIFTVGLTGGTGGKMAGKCDVCICVPSTVTARIQEAHILIGHILCGLVEDSLFKQ